MYDTYTSVWNTSDMSGNGSSYLKCAGLDLEDSFFHVPMDLHGKKNYMNGKFYFSVFKNSPRILTFIIKLVLCFLCVRRISLTAYMTNFTSQVRCVCGCSINWVKTFLDTTWTLIHLGFLLNTNTNTITLPEDKTSQVEIWVKKLLHQGSPLRMSSVLCGHTH